MAPAAPTPREILLLSLLLFILLITQSPSLPKSELAKPEPKANLSAVPPTLSRPKTIDTQLKWSASPVPQTKVVSHVPGKYHAAISSCILTLSSGWTIFDRLYILKGVLYIVSDEPRTVPDVRFIYSKGIFILPGPEAAETRIPSEEDIRIISSSEAKKLFGTGAQIMDGVTVRVLLFADHNCG